MNKDGTECTVALPAQPDCDICRSKGLKTPAIYDCKTLMGPWAYMCPACYRAYAIGLGMGLGQKLKFEEAR
jgi:hypothetical protein